MRRIRTIVGGSCWLLALLLVSGPKAAFAQDGAEGLQKVNHIIVLMQENHSFDNYFGALSYAPGSPYHSPSQFSEDDGTGGCSLGDHQCVDGLSCLKDANGGLHCFNSNIDGDGHSVFAFHDSRRCVLPDLDHSWVGSHR